MRPPALTPRHPDALPPQNTIIPLFGKRIPFQLKRLLPQLKVTP
jgi:hypothetical protein